MTITKKNTLTWNTDILKEWDERNAKEPKDYVPGSHYKAHWIYSKNSEHRWTLEIRLRNKGAKCPFCTNQRVSKENNLAVLNPELAAEWHPTKNGELTPEQVVPGAGKKVWWRCSKHPKHEWPARITDRNDGRRCPYCTNRKVCETNNLSVVNPSLAAEWHPTKNGDLTPYDVVFGSGHKVWWKCKEKGHEFPNRVVARQTRGCRHCSNSLVCDDNNLVVLNPEMQAYQVRKAHTMWCHRP
ncbi:zinc-ribbon domain-containing protein [Peribacillus sp. YIM B13477]|uniref:zinc-ribbon domain-containing protein n=1 Tax=Peribacillus sp. YIM B13477 TaxID=3366300 RepID=UPI0036700A68